MRLLSREAKRVNQEIVSLFGGETSHVRVKVCGISSIGEARMALEAGADALGLVSQMPSGPGVISDAQIGEIARWVGSRVPTVLLTCKATAGEIAEQAGWSAVSIVQIVDSMADHELAILGELLPEIAIMPVIHVRDTSSIEEARALERHANLLLLDSGNPTAAVKELGGTGRVHDWAVSAELCATVQRPVFLAGGLTSMNVASAIAQVSPFGVDVCSGVRSGGRLDSRKLSDFFTAARTARKPS